VHAGLSRQDPQLLSRLATATGLHILTNTGYYGAAKDRCVPRHACEESADQLASRWVKQWTNGIEGTVSGPGSLRRAWTWAAFGDRPKHR